MQDRFDSPPISDFPADPVMHYDLLFWAAATVCLIVFACVLTLMYKKAERRMGFGAGDAIDQRVKAVMKVLSGAAKAGFDDQATRAEDSLKAVNDQFGRTLSLASDLSKAVSKLNTAVDGTKEELFKGHGVGGVMAGGTVINIAVNSNSDGAPLAAAGTAVAPGFVTAEAAAEKVPMSPMEKSEAVWKAIQKLFNYWKNLSAVTAAFRAAQQQLMASPEWKDPPEDELSRVRKP